MNEAAPEVGNVVIDATTHKAQLVELLKEARELGVSPDMLSQQLELARKSEKNAMFDSARGFLDAAPNAGDSALQAALADFERLAFDPAHPVDESFRIALMNSIATVRARAEQETRVQDPAQQAQPQQAAQPQEQPLAEQVTPAAKQIHGPATAAEATRREQEHAYSASLAV